MATKFLMTLAGAIWLGAMTQTASADPVAQCTATDAPSWTVLSKTLRNPDLGKGEFETTASYKARIAKAFGTTTLRVVVPMTVYGKYDADHEKLDLENSDLASNFDIVPIGGDRENWLGARIDRMRVTGTGGPEETDYDLVFKGAGANDDKATLSLHIPLADAKKQIADLKIVVAGEIVAPFTVFGAHQTAQTVGVVVRPICGAIIDGKSGHVLATVDPARIGF